MANTAQHKCISGQSFIDVCLNTYGNLDYFVKLLNDNGFAPDDVPNTGQAIMWEPSLISNSSSATLINNNSVKYATLLGYGIPDQPNPIMATYTKPQPQVTYTATSNGETVASFPQLQAQGAVVLGLVKEIKPLPATDFTTNYPAGTISLIGHTLAKGETLFLDYAINATTK